MKFQLLPVGARFEFEGKVYQKDGPLTATSEHGGQRMIPRFAALKPLDAVVAATTAQPGRRLDELVVAAAFEAYHTECGRILNSVALDELRRQALQAELAAARTRFLAELKQGTESRRIA
jgi:hypothetical protein